MAAEIIFISAAIMLAWSYILYPALVFAVAAASTKHETAKDKKRADVSSPLPSVSVLLAAHNEESVISEKIKSLLASDYPTVMLEIIIGSDASDDRTNHILEIYAASDTRIKIYTSDIRRGKSAMLNDLASLAAGDILIITDANVIFAPDTIRALTEGFDSRGIGLCDATAVMASTTGEGVTMQENLYSRFETSLRRAEGDAWGTMTGPYGGCYAIRRSLFPTIPENTLVDDLFVGLSVLRKGYILKNIPEAVVTEDTLPEISGQFRRRVRIAAGSFQNLFRFGPLPSKKMIVSISFFSHKVIRWFTPLFLALFFMTTVILSDHSLFYFCLSALQLILILLSALDLALKIPGRKIKYLRYVTQFLLMNAALTAGLIKSIKGIRNGIWEPTRRYKNG
jgi:cellulose synthase/poly-beta-1,6-N-acetylglucosamine synthase-like glycosyltransferase